MTNEGRDEIVVRSTGQVARYIARAHRGEAIADLLRKAGVSVSTYYAWHGSVREGHAPNVVGLAEAAGFEIVMRKRGG